MLKRFATTLIVLGVATGSLLAQAKVGGAARQIAMGGSQAGSQLILNPFIMDDPALMYFNPAYQASYRNYGWMNIGGGTLSGTGTTTLPSGDNGYGAQNAGINFSLSKDWTVGAILSHDPSGINALVALPGAISGFGIYQRTPTAIPAVTNMWEVVTSYDMGSVDLGFGFSLGSSRAYSKTTSVTPAASMETEGYARMFGFRGGVNMDLGSGNSFDASVALRLDKIGDKITISPASATAADGEYSASATELVVGARAKLKVSSKVNFVPYAVFATASTEPKEDTKPAGAAAPTAASLKLSATALAVGVGGEYRTPNIYLAGGISFQTVTAKGEYALPTPAPGIKLDSTLTYTALPVINLGGEWWFTDWLAGRGGYFRSLGNVTTKTETPTGTSETQFPLNHSFIILGGLGPGSHDGIVTLGLGFRFGAFSLDATISEEALRRGLGLIGASDNINTFGLMNASYNFD